MTDTMPMNVIIIAPRDNKKSKIKCGSRIIYIPITDIRRKASKREGLLGYVTENCNA
jgi:hypothetical protein